MGSLYFQVLFFIHFISIGSLLVTTLCNYCKQVNSLDMSYPKVYIHPGYRENPSLVIILIKSALVHNKFIFSYSSNYTMSL